MEKWPKYLNRHFAKDDMQMVNMHMKRHSPPKVRREMQIKIPLRSLFNRITHSEDEQILERM